MAVIYNKELRGWQIVGRGGFYSTEAEAKAAEGASPSVASGNTYDDTDFARAFTTEANPAVKAPPPRATSPDGLTFLDDGSYTTLYYDRIRGRNDPSYEYHDPTFRPSAEQRASGYKFDSQKGLYYTEAGGVRTYIGNDPLSQHNALNTPVFSIGNDPNNPLSAGDPSQMGAGQRIGTEDEALAKNLEYLATGSSAGASGAGGTGGSPGAPTGNREGPAAGRTNDAEDMAIDVIDENRAENDSAWADARARYDDLGPADYALSDEARNFQREGLQQQRDLLERLLGFDPNQYAAQFADQTLARQIALGRSQGGGYAAQQAGVMAAMDQAPALYAEGARQASALENQRLGAAQAVTKAFGDLGTMTRGQDETRAQFDAELPLEIANSVATLTQGQVSLNQQESQMFADMWLDFAQLQSVYAGMDSDEQIAWWQNEAQKRGQDKQLQGILASLRADGAISSKDLIGGLFQLGGSLIGAGGSVGAAYAGRK